MRVLSIGWTGLRRLLKDRSNIFFVFIFPLAIIILVGSQFGTGGTRVVASHAGGPLAQAIVERLEAQGIAVDEVEDEEAVANAVERGHVPAGIVLPSELDEVVGRGEPIEIGFVSRPDSSGSLQPILSAALAEATADHRVARVLAPELDIDYPSAVERVSGVSASGVEVETETIGEALFGADTSPFSVGASQQLVLFVFLTALTGSAALIQSRQLGVTSRMLSTPTSVREVVVGEGLARFLVGLFQGLYIVVATLLVFGVEWGNPVGWVPLLVLFAATGAGAAMLIGSVFDNDQQAGGISVMIGLGLAAIGGAMLPLELFSPTMTRIAHFTPHAWAVDGFAELVYRGGTLADIMGELGVLAIYASVLLLLAGWILRRKISRG